MARSETDISIEAFLNSNPLPSYIITDQEVGATSYYGYQNRGGSYYIMQAVTTGATVAYRYYKGAAGVSYATAWAGRAALTYSYPTGVF